MSQLDLEKASVPIEQWEYMAVDTVISGWRDTGKQLASWVDSLNALGAEGWEMVTDLVIHNAGHNGTQFPVVMLKRRVRL